MRPLNWTVKTDGSINLTLVSLEDTDIFINSVSAMSNELVCGTYGIKTGIPADDVRDINIPAHTNCAGSRGKPYRIDISITYEKEITGIAPTSNGIIKGTYE